MNSKIHIVSRGNTVNKLLGRIENLDLFQRKRRI